MTHIDMKSYKKLSTLLGKKVWRLTSYEAVLSFERHFFPRSIMSHDNPTLHDQGKKLKHQGWKDQVEGTMKKIGGDLTDDKKMHAEGEAQKTIGDAERTTGKFVENVTK